MISRRVRKLRNTLFRRKLPRISQYHITVLYLLPSDILDNLIRDDDSVSNIVIDLVTKSIFCLWKYIIDMEGCTRR